MQQLGNAPEAILQHDQQRERERDREYMEQQQQRGIERGHGRGQTHEHDDYDEIEHHGGGDDVAGATPVRHHQHHHHHYHQQQHHHHPRDLSSVRLDEAQAQVQSQSPYQLPSLRHAIESEHHGYRMHNDADPPRPTYISVSAPAPGPVPSAAASTSAAAAAAAAPASSSGSGALATRYVSAFEDFTNIYRAQVEKQLLEEWGEARDEDVNEILKRHWESLNPEKKRMFGDRRYDSR